jgi:hypothetical protein
LSSVSEVLTAVSNVMSTPKLSSHHFAAVRTSVVRYATTGRRETSSTQVAADLCRALNVSSFGSDNAAPKAAIDALVFDLQRLNAVAFSRRYLADLPAVAPTKRGALLSLPALLKALHSVRYSCDGGNESGASLRESLAILDRVIDAITDAIIAGLPEYACARWSI